MKSVNFKVKKVSFIITSQCLHKQICSYSSAVIKENTEKDESSNAASEFSPYVSVLTYISESEIRCKFVQIKRFGVVKKTIQHKIDTENSFLMM